MKKLIILAGNKIQFDQYVFENKIPKEDVIYGADINHLRGVEASKVIVIGTFWERGDCFELEREAMSRIKG